MLKLNLDVFSKYNLSCVVLFLFVYVQRGNDFECSKYDALDTLFAWLFFFSIVIGLNLFVWDQVWDMVCSPNIPSKNSILFL